MGKPLYKIRQPEGNVVVQVVKCITTGIKGKLESKDKVDHWLDHSIKEHGPSLVNDVKTTLKVLVLFVPLPIFWALYDQQGSGYKWFKSPLILFNALFFSWTFQATRMDGDIGVYTLLPDQMQVINPLLILAFIPLFTYVVYPLFARCNFLKTPLQRMVCGGLLTAASFAISACVSLALEATYPVLPSQDNGQIRIYNPLNCNATLQVPDYIQNTQIQAMGYKSLVVDVTGQKIVNYSIDASCASGSNLTGDTFEIAGGKAFLYYLSEQGLIKIEDSIDKHESGLPKIRTLTANPGSATNLTYFNGEVPVLTFLSGDNSIFTIEPGSYKLGGSSDVLNFYLGGVYTVLARLDPAGSVEVKF